MVNSLCRKSFARCPFSGAQVKFSTFLHFGIAVEYWVQHQTTFTQQHQGFGVDPLAAISEAILKGAAG